MLSDHKVVSAVAKDGVVSVDYTGLHYPSGQTVQHNINMVYTKDANGICTFKCSDIFLQDLCAILNKSSL